MKRKEKSEEKRARVYLSLVGGHPSENIDKHNESWAGTGVTKLGFCVVEDVLPSPAGGLLSTEQQTNFMWVEGLQFLHGEDSVKAT